MEEITERVQRLLDDGLDRNEIRSRLRADGVRDTVINEALDEAMRVRETLSDIALRSAWSGLFAVTTALYVAFAVVPFRVLNQGRVFLLFAGLSAFVTAVLGVAVGISRFRGRDQLRGLLYLLGSGGIVVGAGAGIMGFTRVSSASFGAGMAGVLLLPTMLVFLTAAIASIVLWLRFGRQAGIMFAAAIMVVAGVFAYQQVAVFPEADVESPDIPVFDTLGLTTGTSSAVEAVPPFGKVGVALNAVGETAARFAAWQSILERAGINQETLDCGLDSTGGGTRASIMDAVFIRHNLVEVIDSRRNTVVPVLETACRETADCQASTSEIVSALDTYLAAEREQVRYYRAALGISDTAFAQRAASCR